MLEIALIFFLVADPFGSAPIISSLIKNFNLRQQLWILFRECSIALALALCFQYFGEFLLKTLMIEPYALTLAGGILLFLIALEMIFAIEPSEELVKPALKDPFIVPIATPLLTGPSLLAIIMNIGATVENKLIISGAILIAWIGVFAILIITPYFQKVFGDKFLKAIENLMGMVLLLLATEMIMSGIKLLIKAS